jgi:hypothetical protein
MKDHKYIYKAICLFTALSFSCYAASGDNYLADPSKSALSYLQLPVSARMAGMGGAVSAFGDNPSCAMINPAMTAKTNNTQFELSGEKLTLDRQHYFGGAVYPFTSLLAAIGFGWTGYGVDNIERRDPYGIRLGEFSDRENTIALMGAGGLRSNLLLGGAFKYHQQVLESSTAQGFSADAGLYLQVSEKVNLALSGRNLGWKFKWDTGQEERFAPGFRIGSAIIPLKDIITIASDLEWTPGNYPQGHGGIEYWLLPQFCIRAGTQAPNPIQGSGGFGIRYKAVSLDYSFTYHQSGLGHSHLVTLRMEFGKK